MADIGRRMESHNKWSIVVDSSFVGSCTKPDDDNTMHKNVDGAAAEVEASVVNNRNGNSSKIDRDPSKDDNASRKNAALDDTNNDRNKALPGGNDKHDSVVADSDKSSAREGNSNEDTSHNDTNPKQSSVTDTSKKGDTSLDNDKAVDNSPLVSSDVKMSEKDDKNAVTENKPLSQTEKEAGKSNRDTEAPEKPHRTSEVKDGYANSSCDVPTQSTMSEHNMQHKQQEQPLATPQIQVSSSFNQTLKAALDTYHKTHTLVKSNNDPPIPTKLPPPFLSHEEECTLKTALAFVMTKARVANRKEHKERANKKSMAVSGGGVHGGHLPMNGSSSQSPSPMIGSRVRSALTSHVGGKLGTANGSLLKNKMLQHSSLQSVQNRDNNGSSLLLGGLLSAPPPGWSSNCSNGNGSHTFDQKLMHVRDVLKLAVSSVLPLYRGALEEKESYVTSEAKDDDATILEESERSDLDKKKDIGVTSADKVRRPCAVYDYEAAVQSSNEHSLNNGQATLDGLCQHAITRLSALIHKEELKTRSSRLRAVVEEDDGENDENNSNANGSPTVVTNKSRETAASKTLPGQQAAVGRKDRMCNTIRNAILNLISNDLIGDAYLRGCASRSSASHVSSNTQGECAEHCIEKIMAVCHVLHRLLFLDQACNLGTECVNAICSVLSDLYTDQYYGRRRAGAPGEENKICNSLDHDKDGSAAGSSIKSMDNNCTSSSSTTKEKYQVVPSRWSDSSSVSSGYIHERHERRRRSVDHVLSRRQWSSSNIRFGNTSTPQSGIRKRVHDQREENYRVDKSSTTKNTLPLPRIGDVLTVNLLRLLEGAAAIRLHHRQQQQRAVLPSPSTSRYAPFVSSYSHANKRDREYMLERVTSIAATEVLTEIRQIFTNSEMILPLQVEDAATFYYNEKAKSRSRTGMSSSNARVLLEPGGKMMLRLHLFELTSKLALYEKV